MDFETMTDEDLEALIQGALGEQEKRRVLATAEDEIDAVNERVHRAKGEQRGTAWKQPTGAHDAYPKGWVAEWEGKVWENLRPSNPHPPGVSGWREIVQEPEPGEEPVVPDWVQPAGSHDAYAKGDKVTFEGAVYTSTIDNNAWSPAAYPAGWERETPAAAARRNPASQKE